MIFGSLDTSKLPLVLVGFTINLNEFSQTEDQFQKSIQYFSEIYAEIEKCMEKQKLMADTVHRSLLDYDYDDDSSGYNSMSFGTLTYGQVEIGRFCFENDTCVCWLDSCMFNYQKSIDLRESTKSDSMDDLLDKVYLLMKNCYEIICFQNEYKIETEIDKFGT
jgi:hypothetical protein